MSAVGKFPLNLTHFMLFSQAPGIPVGVGVVEESNSHGAEPIGALFQSDLSVWNAHRNN